MTNESLNQGVDEDIELRELLISNLESRGILSKIKADLRAAIFQCLDEKSTHQLLSAEETQIPLSLCCDLLDKLGLLSTSKVLQTELGSVTKATILNRDEVKKRMNIDTENQSAPLLNYLLDKKELNQSKPELSEQDLESKARDNFNHYDHGNFNRIHLEDAANALMDLFPCLPESQAEFLFSDLKYKSELSFEEWFEIVKNFHQMCAQVHCPPASSENKEVSSLNFQLDKLEFDTKDNERGDNADTQNEFNQITGEVTTRTNYTSEYSEFGTRTETSDQEITEGALPDSEVSDSEEPDLNFGSRSNNHNEMTEDFSLRSEDQTSKYADFIENV